MDRALGSPLADVLITILIVVSMITRAGLMLTLTIFCQLRGGAPCARF